MEWTFVFTCCFKKVLRVFRRILRHYHIVIIIITLIGVGVALSSSAVIVNIVVIIIIVIVTLIIIVVVVVTTTILTSATFIVVIWTLSIRQDSVTLTCYLRATIDKYGNGIIHICECACLHDKFYLINCTILDHSFYSCCSAVYVCKWWAQTFTDIGAFNDLCQFFHLLGVSVSRFIFLLQIKKLSRYNFYRLYKAYGRQLLCAF